jgi:hypothetical protein
MRKLKADNNKESHRENQAQFHPIDMKLTQTNKHMKKSDAKQQINAYLPGTMSAGSMRSGLFVAPMMKMSPV